MSRWPCKDYVKKGTSSNSFCEKWHPPECLFYKSESDCRFDEKYSFTHRHVEEQPSKRSKKNVVKSTVTMLKKNEYLHRTGLSVENAYSSNTRQLNYVCQDIDSSKSSSILRKSSDIRNPIRCVKFTKVVVRHADIRDQNPSLGLIYPYESHQRDPCVPKFEDRSQEETEWQEQGVRKAARKLVKSVLNLKEQERATFFSPSENRELSASSLKSDEREFVVDSDVSMQSRSPTIVITVNGEVQTHEETTVYVRELDIFLTMKVLENTSVVLSLGKLYDENGYSYLWINNQKPHLIENGIRI